MNIITLTTSWQRSWGAMFKTRLGDTALAFIYPHAAPRKFHTFFCPPLRILALDEDGIIVFDQVIQPRSFVRIPASCVVLELDPDSELPPGDELLRLVELSKSPSLPRGGIDESVGLGSLVFAILAQAVADIRRVNEANLRSPKIDPALLEQRFSAWERGSIANSAGFILDFGDMYSLPWKTVSISQQILNAEQQHIEELFAASVAGAPWKPAFDRFCLRCGKPGSWRPVVSPPLGVPVESAWRYQRPENAVPLCNRCAYRLEWHQREYLRLDMVWGLWGPRFEAFWQWHQAIIQKTLPQNWDRQSCPLWPHQYSGSTWHTGSGAWQYADPRGPEDVCRNKTHRAALARALAPGRKTRHLATSPPLSLVKLEETRVIL